MQNHGATLCAMTLCVLFMCTASVYSKQTPVTLPPAPVAESFTLKNPDAFDPARRRSVRAMKVPRETAAHMASGIDAAEAQAAEAPAPVAEQPSASPPRVAEISR